MEQRAVAESKQDVSLLRSRLNRIPRSEIFSESEDELCIIHDAAEEYSISLKNSIFIESPKKPQSLAKFDQILANTNKFNFLLPEQIRPLNSL